MATTILLAQPIELRAQSAQPPKLILQITVDQLRADLPQRYMSAMSSGGFRYIYESGAVFTNANHTHANTETIVGHVSLATGANPSEHGMIGNVWFDRDENRLVYNVEDAQYPLLSKDADVNKKTEIDPTQRKARSSGRSPRNIMVSTFSDELASFTANKSKIFAVSVKDRGAISMAGHQGKAFWFSKKTGEFVTSQYYYDQYPQWVSKWNNANHFKRYENTSWQLSQPEKNYLLAGKDLQKGEISLPGFGNTFPHHYGDASSKYFTTFLTLSPAGDELTADFAKKVIENEGIGQDNVTDYLSVSFSATDYVGHIFGPSSLEMEDNMLRLDKTLASLLAFVEKNVGLDNTLIVLSADHGSADTAEYNQRQGLDAQHIDVKGFDFKTLDDKLAPFGIDHRVVKNYQHPYIYLDHGLISEKSLSIDELETVIAGEIVKSTGIAYAITSSQIKHDVLPDTRIHKLVANNHNPQRSGDIYVVFKPNYFINDMEGLHVASHHGSPWRYDTHVPIVFAGAGIKPTRISTEVSAIDIAPTLSTLIGTKLPTGASGSVLQGITYGQN